MPLESIPVLGTIASTALGNTMNVSLAREQRAFDYRMWKENNEYNSPVNQVKRLRQAGLNPALAMQNGMMGSGLSSSPTGGQQAPTYDFSPISQGLRDSVDLYQNRRMQNAQIDNLNEQTTNQAIRNRYENQRQIIEIDKLLSEKGLTDAQKEYYVAERDRLIKENKYIDERNASAIALNDAQAEKATADALYTSLMADYQQIVNQYAPQSQEQILENLRSTGKEILAAAAAHGADAAYKSALKFLTGLQSKGVEIDNESKPRFAKAIADKAESEALEAASSADAAGRLNRFGFVLSKFIGADVEEILLNRRSIFNDEYLKRKLDERNRKGGVR